MEEVTAKQGKRRTQRLDAPRSISKTSFKKYQTNK
jgi:hypothetical protein